MSETNGYAKLVSWSVENFMSIQKATCEFDDRNIINLKGYNDSGKSAMLRALDVLFYNMRPNAQVNFINDDADYFRIVAKFSDGVVILRDKYSNGQSLYEMYKDDELLYSTKVQGVLSKVSNVPEPIQTYLGMIEYDGTLLNSRTCFEKQLLVQTSGGDNYKLLNAVLKSEELATASKLLNEDKNKMGVEINKMTNAVDTYKEFLTQTDGLTEEMVQVVESLDTNIDMNTEQLDTLTDMQDTTNELSNLVICPELSLIDKDAKFSALSDLVHIQETIDSLTITPEIPEIDSERYAALNTLISDQNALNLLSIPPRVETIDSTRYSEIRAIYDVKERINSLPIQEEIAPIDTSRFESLTDLLELVSHYEAVQQSVEQLDSEYAQVQEDLTNLITEVGSDFVQCPNCGEIIAVKSS